MNKNSLSRYIIYFASFIIGYGANKIQEDGVYVIWAGLLLFGSSRLIYFSNKIASKTAEILDDKKVYDVRRRNDNESYNGESECEARQSLLERIFFANLGILITIAMICIISFFIWIGLIPTLLIIIIILLIK